MNSTTTDIEQDQQMLVLYFDADNSTTRAKVKEIVTRLSSKPIDDIDRYLARGRLVLKRKADPVSDRRIVDMWQGTGAVCRFERAAEKAEGSKTAAGAQNGTANQPASAPPTTMICPNCQCEQTVALECNYCGVIISKAKVKPKAPAAQAPADPFPTPGPSTPSRWMTIKGRYDQITQRVMGWLGDAPSQKGHIVRWSQRLSDAMVGLAVVFVAALFLETVLLQLGNGMWYIYMSTPMGEHFLGIGSSLGVGFQNLAQSNLVMTGLTTTLTALLACLMVAAAGRFLHLVRLFYEPAGLGLKLFLWIIPLTAVTGWSLHQRDPMIPFDIACVIAFLPVFMLLKRSTYLTRAIVPELGTIIDAVRTKGGISIHGLLNRAKAGGSDNAGRPPEKYPKGRDNDRKSDSRLLQ